MNRILPFISILLFVWSVDLREIRKDLPEDAYFKCDEMIAHHGYPVEKYNFTTSDGYMLQIFRIPGKKGESLEHALANPRSPFIMQHGYIDDSDVMVANGDPYAPAFFFATGGYDIWLPNIRGNRYSRINDHMSPDDKEFWDFNMENMGMIDMREYIAFIKNKTGYSKVGYLGHSQGTSQGFIVMSLDPMFFVNNIDVFVAWAPVTQLTHIGNFFLKTAAKLHFDKIFEWEKMWEVFPFDFKKQIRWAKVCETVPFICSVEYFFSTDKEPKYDNQERIPVYEAHLPAGTSLEETKMFFQLMTFGGFNKYRRNSDDPIVPFPLENTKIVTTPTALVLGGDDLESAYEDAQWLYSQIGKFGFIKMFKQYSHLGHATFLIPNDESANFMHDTKDFVEEHYPHTRKPDVNTTTLV